MLLRASELLLRFLYEPTWRFFESIHDCMMETWEWFVVTLEPYAWQMALLGLVIVLDWIAMSLLSAVLPGGCFW